MSSKRGIENAKMRDAQKISITCKNCGETKEITFGHYRRLKDKDNWRCKKCSQKMWYSEMSDKEREDWLNKRNHTLEVLSEEEKERRHIDNINRWENKSDEEKHKHAEYSSINMKKYWDNLSDEEKAQRSEKSLKIFQKYRDNLSDEQKRLISLKLSQSLKNRWANISAEEYEKRQRETSENMKLWWGRVTQDTLKSRSEKLSKAARNWWSELTPEKYNKWLESVIKSRKLRNAPTKTESAFMNYLNIGKIKFDYGWISTIKHPDFDKKFPFNPVTGSKFVSPYREWDFRIHTNDGFILVDIDGSIHDPSKTNTKVPYGATGVKIIISELIAFNDAKRPYQTDGLPAYVVQCYDDNLDNDSKVFKVGSNEIISFRAFMEIIYLNNMAGDELNDLFTI